MSNTGELYIHLKQGKYVLNKYVLGEHVYFGSFDTLEEAKNHKEYCIRHGWSKDCILKRYRDLPMYIYETKNGFKVQYDSVRYGVFKTLEEAVEHKEYCIKHDWSYSCIVSKYAKHNLPKYISFCHGKFVVQKQLDDKKYVRRYYDSLDDALECRDLLLDNDWDVSCLSSEHDGDVRFPRRRQLSCCKRLSPHFRIARMFGVSPEVIQ